jgi:outer membrane protein assembly factor BamB
MSEMGRRRLLGGISAVTVASLATGRMTQAAEGASRRAPGTLLWQAQAGSGYSGHEVKSIVTGGGMVYAASNAQSDGNSAIYALNAATGKLAWHTPPAGPVPYAVGLDAVYGFQLTGGNKKTSVVALSAVTGRPIWTYAAGDMLNNATEGSLAYSNGKVFIGGGLSDTFSSAANDVIALEAGTGRPLWKLTTDTMQAPAVTNGILCIADGQRVVGLNAATGTRSWQTEVGGSGIDNVPTGNFTTTAGAVVGWTIYSTFALDAGTGRLLWRSSAGIPALAAVGIVFLVKLADAATMHAVDARTGASVWTRALPQDLTTFAAAEGTIYFGAGATVTAVAAATYRSLWTYRLSAPATGVAVTGGVAFVADRHGTVHALVA